MRILAILLIGLAAINNASPLSSSTSKIQYCSDLSFLINGSFQSTKCTISQDNISSFFFDLAPIDITSTSSFTNLSHRSTLKKSLVLPLPIIPEHGHLLWKEPFDAPNLFKQCTNNGPAPSIPDVKKLCAAVDSSYIIGRAAQGGCTCKVWSQRSAVFSACNCDQCDALVIPYGLRDKCREISEHCTTKGYRSGVMQFPDANVLFEQHVKTANETGKHKHAMSGLETECLGQALGLNLTCNSGNMTRAGWDRSSKFIKCKRLGITKKCWRTTNQENVWWEW